MKTRAKTFIVLLFVCLFMAMPLINASALELTVEDMKENLVEKGLPEEYLQKLSDTHIKSLYEDGCQYILEYEEVETEKGLQAHNVVVIDHIENNDKEKETVTE